MTDHIGVFKEEFVKQLQKKDDHYNGLLRKQKDDTRFLQGVLLGITLAYEAWGNTENALLDKENEMDKE